MWQSYLALISIPSVLNSTWFINCIRRCYAGILGLMIGYVVIGFIIGGYYSTLTRPENLPAFVVLYGLLQACGHLKSGGTIGLISCESFFIAASGMDYGLWYCSGIRRSGATIATQVLTPICEIAGPASTFYVVSGVCILMSAIYLFLLEGTDRAYRGRMRSLRRFWGCRRNIEYCR
jgi:hypothetical protein